jgi:hypothetical protein
MPLTVESGNTFPTCSAEPVGDAVCIAPHSSQNFAFDEMAAPHSRHLGFKESSAGEGIVMNPPNDRHANLLVVFLLVTLYISWGGESRQVLPHFGY